MLWVTRAGVHIDRAACAWLIARFVDDQAEFGFVAGPEEVPEDANPFDMRGVEHGHHGGDCTFETALSTFRPAPARPPDRVLAAGPMTGSGQTLARLTWMSTSETG